MSLSRKRGRKLLVASLGVAAVSYVGCGTPNTGTATSTKDAGSDAAKATPDAMQFVGNLMAMIGRDAGTDATSDAAKDTGIAMMGVGNLMIAPSDAGSE